MASSLALKRLVSSNLLANSVRQVRPLSAVAPWAFSRFFNTNVSVREYMDDDRSSEVDHRPDSSIANRRGNYPFADVFDPFSTRSVNQLLNMVDQLMDFPISTSRGVGAGGFRKGWDAKETDDGLHLRMDMPGLGKEDVKISVEHDTLIIKGEGPKESVEENDDNRPRYVSRLELPEKLYKINEIKAEMKNGVLKIFVPKVTEEERTDVFHVKVE